MLPLSEPLTGPLAARRSQAAHVYEVVRRDILSGKHGPNQKLKIQDLADELVSAPARCARRCRD